MVDVATFHVLFILIEFANKETGVKSVTVMGQQKIDKTQRTKMMKKITPHCVIRARRKRMHIGNICGPIIGPQDFKELSC